ncbi:NAD(P)-dependent oxidoreductase [Enterococcus timonensis]|uniref:NAD(P)-dependent oxidoreductase n=1 Tax=Enterococcus timonensis TaxID=1852364 RepID=UPI0008D93E21|nr:NAD(P)H-binding protein [Enterococcus timonensis]
MKIAIIGATGRAGGFILKEALARGLEVTAIVRHPEKLTEDVPVLAKDLFALTTNDLEKFDVVVDAFNAPNGKEELHEKSVDHLVQILTGTKTRLIVVGGASSLFINQEKTIRMIEQVPKDAPFYPVGFYMTQSLLDLKKSTVDWTYLSPALYFNPNGEKTGKYRVSDDFLVTDERGRSEISMADYAIALVDEIQQPKHQQKHFSVLK